MRLGVKLACSLSQLQREFLSCQMDVDKATDTLTVLIGIWVKNSRIVADDNMGDDCSFCGCWVYWKLHFYWKRFAVKDYGPISTLCASPGQFHCSNSTSSYLYTCIYIYLFISSFFLSGFPPPVKLTFHHHHDHRFDMTLAVAEVLSPNKLNYLFIHLPESFAGIDPNETVHNQVN